MEEGALRAFLVGKLLHIVQNQHVHQLVVTEEIRHLVGVVVVLGRAGGVHILVLESVGIHVEHHLFRILFLDGDADGLGEMGLAKTGTGIDEQRIEGVPSRRAGDAQSGRTGQAVALALDEVLHRVLRIEVRIDIEPLDARDQVGTAFIAGGHIRCGDIHVADPRRRALVFRDECIRNAHFVAQAGVGTDDPVQHLAQQIQEIRFDMFADVIRLDFDGENIVVERDGTDRSEPGIIRRNRDVVPDHFLAFFPCTVVFLHSHLSVILSEQNWVKKM